MRQLFISYARENKPDVDELVHHLDALGYHTWVDSSLRGGQAWWEEILRRIAESDVFVAIVSGHTLNSVACKREMEWALALNKPVLPVAVDRLPKALPRTLSMRQIVDYSNPTPEVAFALAGALGNLPPGPPVPEQLPEPPPAPLSYLSDLVEQVASPEPLTHEQQRQMLVQLQPALRSVDSEEREGGRYVLDMFSKRDDLYADVEHNLAELGLAEPETQTSGASQMSAAPAPTAPQESAEQRGNVADDPEWANALSAFFARRWPEAVERLEALQARYPGEGRIDTRLTDARRQRDIEDLSAKAEAAATDGNWDVEVAALVNLTALDAANPDVANRLEQARAAQRRKALVDDMTALHQAGQWMAVVAAADELGRLDPDHPDPGGIVSDAKGKICEADLADRYAQALNHLDQEEWQHAADLFAAIEQEQPGYRDAATLLATAQQKNTRDTRSEARGQFTSTASAPNATAGPELDEQATKSAPLSDSVTPTSRRSYRVLVGAVVIAVVIVGVLITMAIVRNSSNSRPPSAEVIKNARVGDCIHRTGPGTNNPEASDTVVVSAATCGTSYATDRVTIRTDDIADCGSEGYVKTTAYSPPIILCLTPE